MITSLQNPRIKQVVALQSRRHARRKAGLIAIEGLRLVQEAADSGLPIEEIFYTEDFLETSDEQPLFDALTESGASMTLVDDAVMQAISDTPSPQGILAVMPPPDLPIPEEPTSVLIIDGIGDPGNMGTIMRSAIGAGVELMVITAGTVDLENPKVLRAAMGAHFRLPTRQLSWEGIASRYAEKMPVYLADSVGGTDYTSLDWTQRCALIVSDEANGPSEGAHQTAHLPITIPMPGKAESLNVGMATSIILFEMVRQRRATQGA